jgi:chemotaxis protein MotB
MPPPCSSALGQVVSSEPGGTDRPRAYRCPAVEGGLGANNWSLSAGRAEATRQALLRKGIAEARFRRIEGVADREPLVRDKPEDPRNRRISILLIR